MSFDTIKQGLVESLGALEYKETEYSAVESIPSSEYGKSFILNPVSGENDEDTSETISSLVYDIQKWEIKLPFGKSSENQNEINDDIQRAREALVKRLDNPSYWASYARIQKFKNWKIEDTPNYFLLTIELKVIDTITY